MPWGIEAGSTGAISQALTGQGAATVAIEADLAVPDAPARIFDAAERALGNGTVESFDRHFAVNARAAWLLIREYGLRFCGTRGTGRVISLTSDHTVGNLPYGASKGALDRITLAAGAVD